jgi:serine/threonine protein kinase
VAVFLRAAVGIARALGTLRRGVVLRDLSPSSILIDTATGEAWLTGLELSPHLVRDPAADLTRLVARNLAYMAPEQSGRMNRSVDSRSDLYSFGALLYEMLTGTPPFSATAPIEWVHCHIARQPVPSTDRVAGIPPVVSALVLKLIAKNPEDRYQTASGVESDLRKCLFDWESTEHVEPFPLAARDVPDWLLIPERLYGREREVALLVDAFERVTHRGRQTLCLVSGYSGVGKSSVVNEL